MWKKAASYNHNSEYVVDSLIQEKIKFALSDNRCKKLDSKFAEKIIKLIDDENLYKEFSQNAVKMYNEKFTAELMTKKMEEFYSDILEGK